MAKAQVLAITPSVELYGADRMFLRAVKALAAAGGPTAVVVVAPARGELTSRIADLEVDVTVRRFEVLRKSLLGPRALAALVGMIGDVLRAYRLIGRKLDRDGVVYVNTVTAPQWLVAARLARRKCVCHVREREAGARLLELALVLPLLLCERVLANSRSTASWLQGVAPRLGRRTRVVYNGVVPVAREKVPAIDKVALAGALPAPTVDEPAPVSVLVVGRLSPRKGQDWFLDSVAKLVHSGIPLTVTLIGDVFPGYEWYRAELHAQVARHGLTEVVGFAGFHADPAPFYRDADVLVVPSRAEPFGTVALEGMAHSLPVVAAAVEGLMEIVVDGVTGRLVPVDAVDELAEALASLVTDPDLRRRLGSAGFDRVKQEFSIDEYDSRVVAELLPLAS